MGKNSAKEKARVLYQANPKISFMELKIALNDEVQDKTISKYLNEFRQKFGVKKRHVPDQISIKLLEKELSLQLERNPTTSVIKSCIDFLKLKAMTDNQVEELDMTKFIKRGKELNE